LVGRDMAVLSQKQSNSSAVRHRNLLFDVPARGDVTVQHPPAL